MTGRGHGVLVSALLTAGVGGLVALQLVDPWRRPEPRAAQPWPVRHAAGERLSLGATTEALARNSYRRWQPADLREVNEFERMARRHVDIVMWFADWANVADFDAGQARAVAARGSIPEVSWEPWDSRRTTPSQPRYRLSRISSGAFDEYIRRWAKQIAAYRRPVRLRFAQEMNGRWYPWAERANGNRRGEFAAAWRRVHGIFTAAGASNVTWVWSPVAGALDPRLYPGSQFVDVLAVAGFNGGTKLFSGRWRPFARAFGPTLSYLHALAPDKPIGLSETASAETGGSKAKWVTAMFRELARRPYVRSLVWFNVRKEADWRIESSPGARRAFAAGLERTS